MGRIPCCLLFAGALLAAREAAAQAVAAHAAAAHAAAAHGAAATDGLAWQETLADIRARVARGERVAVVLDVDNTVADTRPRTRFAVASFARRTPHASQLCGLRLDQIGFTGAETADLNQVTDVAVRGALQAYWRRTFWNGRNFKHDLPMREVIRRAWQAAAAGAQVHYVTGRVQSLRRATVRELRRLGAPDARPSHVLCKGDVTVATVPFKLAQLDRLGARYHLAWYASDSLREAAAVKAHVPGIHATQVLHPLACRAGLPTTPQERRAARRVLTLGLNLTPRARHHRRVGELLVPSAAALRTRAPGAGAGLSL